MKTIDGFIYTRAGTPCSYTRAEWREQAARLMADGGFIRQEFGETFIHGKDGLIAAEIYAQGVLKREKVPSRSGAVANINGVQNHRTRQEQAPFLGPRNTKRAKV